MTPLLEKKLAEGKFSFAAFKKLALVSKYGNNGAFHVYYHYTSPSYSYQYRMKFHNGTAEKALRAAFYLLFFSTYESERRYVRQGEFKISIMCGSQENSFCAERFDAAYLKMKMTDEQEI